MVSPGNRVGIIFSDISRATPYNVILPPLLEILESIGDVEILFFNATGTHRFNTPVELDTILGAEVAAKYKIVQNDCRDAESHRVVGTTSGGNEITLVSEETKEILRSQCAQLDPAALLHRIRDMQAALAVLVSPDSTSGPGRETLDEFLAQLPRLWQSGDARPTHRQPEAKRRYWRTRKDPFEAVWTSVLLWLQEDPDATAKSLFDRLCREYPGP